jgi:ABC-type multidrug transport system fused ATPase/permease subunit
MVLNDAITIGTIVAFVAYLSRLYGPLTSLSSIYSEFVQSLVSFERVFEYLDKPVEIQDAPNAVVLENVQGHIRFDHVWFRYQSTASDTDDETLPAVVASRPEVNGAGDNKADDDDGHVPVPTRLWAAERIGQNDHHLSAAAPL